MDAPLAVAATMPADSESARASPMIAQYHALKRAHPEVASSTFASVVRTHESGGYVYVTVKVVGRNGQKVEALYEMVQEAGGWRVNALTSRQDDSLL